MSLEGISGLSARVRNLRMSSLADITISLKSNQRTYSTLDQIEGTVTIAPKADLKFDDIDIEFVGTSRAWVDRLTSSPHTPGRLEAYHQFLKLQQPSLQACYPADNLMRKDSTYTLPFLFVVPQQLLERVCRHDVDHASLRDQHLLLPPTFGDKDFHKLDDMVPDMASIRYGIFTRISVLDYKDEDDAFVKRTVASKARKVRIVPTGAEQPPLDVQPTDDEYRLRSTKKVKGTLLGKSKAGTLTLEAHQPRAISLMKAAESEEQTRVDILVRFDPNDEDAVPPRLATLVSRLKVSTFWGTTARRRLPRKQVIGVYVDSTAAMCSSHLSLNSRNVENATWQKYSEDARRDSFLCIEPGLNRPVPAASESYKGKSFHVARITVPVILPKNKALLPSFHTCLISRTYTIKLELGLAGLASGSMSLKLPLQIIYQGFGRDSHGRQNSVDSIAESEVDEAELERYFGPRPTHALSTEPDGRSRIGSQPRDESLGDAPPTYSAVTAMQRTIPVH